MSSTGSGDTSSSEDEASSSTTTSNGDDGDAAAWLATVSETWVQSVGDVSALQDLPDLRVLLPCAGWDAPSQALRMLGIKHTVVGAWEVAPSAGLVLKRLHAGAAGRSLHLGSDGDVCAVCLQDLPDAECLISGPPCPPFSSMGARRSWGDRRSDPFRCIVRWILHLATRSLKCFVLENVMGIMDRGGAGRPSAGGQTPVARQIISDLRKGLKCWHVELLVCNSECAAQSRRRVYIVGYKEAGPAPSHQSKLRDSLPALPRASLQEIIQPGLPNSDLELLPEGQRRNFHLYMRLLKRELRDPSLRGRFAVFHIDRDPRKKFGSSVRTDGLAKCLRAQHDRVFVVSLGQKTPAVRRFLHPAEGCLLQGMSPSIVPPGMTRRQVFEGVGNAMTVPVVGAVLVAVLREALPTLSRRPRKRMLEASSSSASSESEDVSDDRDDDDGETTTSTSLATS